MQFPFLLLVCKFTCSQNSSPERLLLCLKCKVCTPTCQLHKLAEAIINSSEGQQTLAINGAWINSGICKIQTWLAYQKNSFIWYIPEDCHPFFQRCFNTLQIWILLANIIFHLSCSLMRIPYVLLYFFFVSTIPLISSITWPKWGLGPPAMRQEHASTPTCESFTTQSFDSFMHDPDEGKWG